MSLNKSACSLPSLPTTGNYSSSKQFLNAHQPSGDDHVIFTSSTATDRQEWLLSPSMGYLEKSDVVSEEDENDYEINENVSELPNDTSDYIKDLVKERTLMTVYMLINQM